VGCVLWRQYCGIGVQTYDTRIARSDKRDTHPVISKTIKEIRLAQYDLREPNSDIRDVGSDLVDVISDKGIRSSAFRRMRSEM